MFYIQTKAADIAEQALKLSPRIDAVLYFQKTNSTANKADTDCTAATEVPLVSKPKFGPKCPDSLHPVTHL